jgi:hypothetical protein
MSNNNLEQFQALARQLLSQYQVVEQAVEHVFENQESTSKNEMLDAIRSLLTEVKQTEAQLKPLRDILKNDSVSMPPATQATIDQTIQIVTTIIPRIGAIEKSAIDSRESLAPVIRESVRAVQMKSAYSKQRS